MTNDELYIQYLDSNKKIINKYFETRLELFREIIPRFEEEEKIRIIEEFLGQDGRILDTVIGAQKECALSMFSKAGINKPDTKPDTKTKNCIDNQQDEYEKNHKKEELKNVFDKEKLKKWIVEQISEQTGFPIERIHDETKFEEELGMVSIDMIKIFTKLIEMYPDIDTNYEKFMTVSNVKEFIDVVEQLNG